MRHPRGVAQPGSALALGARCREFKSPHPDQFLCRLQTQKAARSTRARSSTWIEHQPSKLGVVGSSPAGRASFPAGPTKGRSMIEVYTWPTPNGHKIHIMLEETGL